MIWWDLGRLIPPPPLTPLPPLQNYLHVQTKINKKRLYNFQGIHGYVAHEG